MNQKVNAVIFDVDGTVADNSHRQHYVATKPKNWDAFFSEMHLDKPKHNVISLLRAIYHAGGDEPIFVTGRDENYREMTYDWLMEYAWPDHRRPFKLYMRRAGDKRPDFEVKREIYEGFIAPSFNVLFVVDDRASVVKMWRDLGLECWQVAEGNF